MLRSIAAYAVMRDILALPIMPDGITRGHRSVSRTFNRSDAWLPSSRWVDVAEHGARQPLASSIVDTTLQLLQCNHVQTSRALPLLVA